MAVTAEKDERVISREMIREHARELFAEKGVQQTSVNDIVRVAGIAKGTFYLYFKNKDDLIEEVFDRYRREFVNAVASKIIEFPKIRYFSLPLIDFFDNHRLFLSELRKNLNDNNGYAFARKTVEEFARFIQGFFNAREDYVISQLEVYCRMIIGMILEICYKFSIEKSIKSREEARVMLGDLLKRFFDCEE